jgi:hypothetical protein
MIGSLGLLHEADDLAVVTSRFEEMGDTTMECKIKMRKNATGLQVTHSTLPHTDTT